MRAGAIAHFTARVRGSSVLAHLLAKRRGCHLGQVGLTFAPHRTMSEPTTSPAEQPNPAMASVPTDAPATLPDVPAVEIGGRASGLDPTRYGDWELNGRCIDF